MIAHQVDGPDADEDKWCEHGDDGGADHDAVPFFPGFSRVCVLNVYVSSNYRDIVFLGNAPIPKYKAPRPRPFNQLTPDGNKGSVQSVSFTENVDRFNRLLLASSRAMIFCVGHRILLPDHSGRSF